MFIIPCELDHTYKINLIKNKTCKIMMCNYQTSPVLKKKKVFNLIKVTLENRLKSTHTTHQIRNLNHKIRTTT